MRPTWFWPQATRSTHHFIASPPYKMTWGFGTRVRPFYRRYSIGDVIYIYIYKGGYDFMQCDFLPFHFLFVPFVLALHMIHPMWQIPHPYPVVAWAPEEQAPFVGNQGTNLQQSPQQVAFLIWGPWAANLLNSNKWQSTHPKNPKNNTDMGYGYEPVNIC